jgi:hypothetical protein
MHSTLASRLAVVTNSNFDKVTLMKPLGVFVIRAS